MGVPNSERLRDDKNCSDSVRSERGSPEELVSELPIGEVQKGFPLLQEVWGMFPQIQTPIQGGWVGPSTLTF